jgi:hypothetical protein
MPRCTAVRSLAFAKIAAHLFRHLGSIKQNANHLARDSLVFDHVHLRTTPLRALLWKKNLPWVKPTHRDTFSASCQSCVTEIFCLRALEIEFASSAKSSIP